MNTKIHIIWFSLFGAWVGQSWQITQIPVIGGLFYGISVCTLVGFLYWVSSDLYQEEKK